MRYPFVQSRYFYRGRRSKIRLLVWHDMESPEAHDVAENVARWLAGPNAPRASAHTCADVDSLVETVRIGDTAWHCPNANADGVGLEIAGRRNQGWAGWRDKASLGAIKNTCVWIVSKPELAHIPDRWLTDAQVADRKTAGHATHEQITRVLGGGSHTDPGPDFPYVYVMQQLAAARQPVQEDDMPLSDADVDRIVEELKPMLLRMAQFLAGKPNSVFNEATVGMPVPKADQ